MSCVFGQPHSEEFDLEYFESGNYEMLFIKSPFWEYSKVLYPSDKISRGGNCVLSRNIFFSGSHTDIIRRFKVENSDLKDCLRRLSSSLMIPIPPGDCKLIGYWLMNILCNGRRLGTLLKSVCLYQPYIMPSPGCWRWYVWKSSSAPYADHLRDNADLKKAWPSAIQGTMIACPDVLIEEGTPKGQDGFWRSSAVFPSMAFQPLHSIFEKAFIKDFYECLPRNLIIKTNGITQDAGPESKSWLSSLITETMVRWVPI